MNGLYNTQSICIKSVYKSVEWPCALYIENSTAMLLFKIKLLTYLHATIRVPKVRKTNNILQFYFGPYDHSFIWLPSTLLHSIKNHIEKFIRLIFGSKLLQRYNRNIDFSLPN